MSENISRVETGSLIKKFQPLSTHTINNWTILINSLMDQEQREEGPQPPFVPAPNWVNPQTMAFINGLSFNGYFLAGNSIANMAQGIPLQGDLDFWVTTPGEFMSAMDEMIAHYDSVNLYPSMVEMFSKGGKLPRLNLIFSMLEPENTVNRFDFDYCRCFWTPGNPIQYGWGARESIKTKLIRQPGSINKIMRKRILKAIKYGYTFQKQFWVNFPQLLQTQNLINPQQWSNSVPLPIRIEDLDMRRFQMKQIKMKITDRNNIQQTLLQLTQQFQKIAGMKNVKLPVLLKFEKNEIELLKKYVKEVVWKNPLSDTHYFEIKIGTNFVNCYPKTQEYSQKTSQYSSQSQLCWEQQLKRQIQEQEMDNSKIVPKVIIPTRNENSPMRIQLNESGSAYLTLSWLPESLIKEGEETFGRMWDLHPKDKHKIIMFEKEVQVSRFSKSYLNTPTDLSHTVDSSYMYSGYNTGGNNEELPQAFVPFYKEIQKMDKRYNQVIANWYQNKDDYIAFHSDCQRGMIDNASVCLVSLYSSSDPDGFRYLEFNPKATTKSLERKFVIRLDHGSVLIMHGTTQEDYRHGIPKSEEPVGPRLSLSFRQMKPVNS